MLKKRLIGVVLIKDGLAVQSFRYGKYLPIGKAECMVENLDRWGADEILVLCIDRSIKNIGPDLRLLKKISSLGIETPLIFGGGIKDLADGLKVIQNGADRICVDALMHNDIDVIKELADYLGIQALIGVFPLRMSNKNIEWLDYRSKHSTELTKEILDTRGQFISEFLIADWTHDGGKNSFDIEIINKLSDCQIPLIAFGGISESKQINSLLSLSNVSAVAIGNCLSYREHSLQSLKKNILKDIPLRRPIYDSKNTLLNNV